MWMRYGYRVGEGSGPAADGTVWPVPSLLSTASVIAVAPAHGSSVF